MDAQNAVESANTKQAASPKRGGVAESDNPKPTVTASSTTTTNNIKPSLNSKTSSISKDSRPATTLGSAGSAQDDDVGPDQNSDAETIVLPGKDGMSPSKPRKVIKHEDKSDGEIDDVLPPPRKHLKDDRDGERNGVPSDAVISSLERKKRHFGKDRQPRNKDASSGLSSAPASPPPHRHDNHEQAHRRRKSGDAHSESGSESSKSRSSKDPIKTKSKSVDRLLPTKRKAPKAESDDEGESRKIRRPRISDTGLDNNNNNNNSVRERDQKSSSTRPPNDKHSTSRNRSLSPHGRPHRRSLSTQLPSQSSNGFAIKKRRPAPLQTTDYHSDDSSASGSPHPRSSKLRSIATPVTGESTISPARMPPHKKHVDNHGQTLLAKACAKGEYEIAKRRLTERPEDLNFADYAGNTPLQIASLNGHEQIVQLLIDAGCNLDCRNSDKETPLLDAVENGHLGVVKLLLKAGVNPRKADAEGHEPLEKVPDDLENAEEIRAALREAKERVGELRRTSEDHQPHDLPDTVSSHGPESPRRSPAASGNSTLAAQRRGGAVRSTKTSNHLLYMSLDEKTLRQAAARGDNETVTRVLQVREHCDDPEALVNAARGGHVFVVELLLALGNANPDPRPVPGLPAEYGTPMLAAIGGENIEVIKLLLNASNFDPTRRYKGETYYEIARRREGPMWKEEEHLLKNAFDEFKKAPKSSSKTKSPGRRDRERELDQESRRTNRNESNTDATRSHKRRPSSPSRDTEPRKKVSSTKVSGSPKEKRRSLSLGNHDEQTSPKRGPGRS
ncbi:ankyrin [Hypoxylon sp. NC0597]|nr:ankyrin [Hypoxylon sp. NC0597]